MIERNNISRALKRKTEDWWPETTRNNFNFKVWWFELIGSTNTTIVMVSTSGTRRWKLWPLLGRYFSTYTGGWKQYVHIKNVSLLSSSKPSKPRKSLYGLKQSLRMWHLKLHTYLDSIGFIRLQAKPSLYIHKEGKILVIIGVYVDHPLLHQIVQLPWRGW